MDESPELECREWPSLAALTGGTAAAAAARFPSLLLLMLVWLFCEAYPAESAWLVPEELRVCAPDVFVPAAAADGSDADPVDESEEETTSEEGSAVARQPSLMDEPDAEESMEGRCCTRGSEIFNRIEQFPLI